MKVVYLRQEADKLPPLSISEIRVGIVVMERYPMGLDPTIYCTVILDKKKVIHHLEWNGSLLRPVALSDEWMEVLGFERKEGWAEGIGSYDWWEKDGYSTMRVIGSTIVLEGVNSKPIRYVHQLQNLWFELIREQLTPKRLVNGYTV